MSIPEGWTTEQFAQLTAICDTFFPSIQTEAEKHENGAIREYFLRSASDLKVPHEIARKMGYLNADMQGQLKLLLTSMNSMFLNFFLTGHFRSFSQLTQEQREGIMLSWSSSFLESKRTAFLAFRALSAQTFFSMLDGSNQNPNWGVIQYPGPNLAIEKALASKAEAYPYEFVSPSANEELEYDVVVIGSGAGGGVVAALLSEAGYKVVVVEKSNYFARKDMTLLEAPSMESMYESGSMVVSENSSITILSGSTFGGGTTINWSASLRTPKHVVDEWAAEHGCPYYATEEYQQDMAAVEKRIGVHDQETVFNSNNSMLKTGCENLGYNHRVIPRNAPGSHTCGFCTFGCKSGEKQGCVETWLADAAKNGAQFLIKTTVEKILHSSQKVTGVLCRKETGETFTIKSKFVFTCASSLNSPAILLRSKVPNANIGKNLFLHPVSAITGFFDQKTQPYDGCLMSVVCKEFETRPGSNYGCLIETPPAHPGLFASASPWKSSLSFKQDMLGYTNAAIFIVITRDRYGGEVKIDANGRPRFHYNLSANDAESLKIGIEGGIRIMAAAGAKSILTLHTTYNRYDVDGSLSPAQTVDAYVQHTKSLPTAPGSLSIFSAHQMGTCRMGKSRETSVVKETGESWDIANLYVADASVFPTASGANPMLTTESVAYSIAKRFIQSQRISNADASSL